MIDIRAIKNGYWWDAQGKFDALMADKVALRELTVQITDKCNRNCVKCNKTNFSFNDMEYHTVARIIKQACVLGLTHIHFTGGEPTLYSEFVRVIKLCRNLALRIDMSTNGYFTLEYIKELIKAGMNSINISWDFIAEKPDCMVSAFLLKIKNEYPSIVDIQLMPPRGTAEKFNIAQIQDFNSNVVPQSYEISKSRFPMVEAKIKEMLDDNAVKGIYHIPIKFPCHRSKSELRVGTKGFTTCTYLYRDGHITCDLKSSVKDAWKACKKECMSIPPVPSMCGTSCSPEVTNFNFFVEIAKITKFLSNKANSPLLKLVEIALDAFKDSEMVRNWFTTPQVMFEERTPLDYSGTASGREEIEQVLKRIKNGIFL